MAGEENFLSRWSRRKSESKDPERAEPQAPVGAAAMPAAAPTPPVPSGREPLPAVESLTPESDFAPFMDPEVDGDVRRQALKTLFSDPRFNTMDMMDVYVDDYSKPDPIPESWMGQLEQLSRLGDRAGRDREEAARRKAEAEAEAEAAGPVAVPDTPAEAPVSAAAAPLPDEGSEVADTGPAIPPLTIRNTGNSGT